LRRRLIEDIGANDGRDRLLIGIEGRLLDVFALYGFNPWRTVLWMTTFVVLFAGVWWWAAQGCERDTCKDETVYAMSLKGNYGQDDKSAEEKYPGFSPLAYSLDVFLPFVNLGYKEHWRPRTSYLPLAAVPLPGAELHGQQSLTVTVGGFLYLLYVTEMLAGLILASLAVTGFAGILRGEDELLVFHAGQAAAAVLSPAEPDGVAGDRTEHPGPEAEGGPGPGAVVQSGQAAPPQDEFGQGRIPGTRTQAQPGPPLQRPGAVPGLRAPAEHAPVEQDRSSKSHEGRQGGEPVMDGEHGQVPDEADQEPGDAGGEGDHDMPPSRSRPARNAPR